MRKTLLFILLALSLNGFGQMQVDSIKAKNSITVGNQRLTAATINGFATQDWVNSLGYITQGDIDPSDFNVATATSATYSTQDDGLLASRDWVTSLGYITLGDIDPSSYSVDHATSADYTGDEVIASRDWVENAEWTNSGATVGHASYADHADVANDANNVIVNKIIHTPTSGQFVQLERNKVNIINPSSALSALTLVLPFVDPDEYTQTVELKFIKNVTSITINPSNNAILKTPLTTANAGNYFKYVSEVQIIDEDTFTINWY